VEVELDEGSDFAGAEDGVKNGDLCQQRARPAMTNLTEALLVKI